MKKLMTLTAACLLALSSCAQDVIQLPKPDKGANRVTLMDALSQRHSERSYSDRALTPEQLSLLLWAANGVNREDGRLTAPTAMNRQDIQLFVCRADGAWLYDAAAHKLTRVCTDDLRAAVATERQAFAKDAPISIVIVSDLRKFGNRPNRELGSLDAGYVSQNIYLAATAMGLGTVARATMDREALAKALGLVEQQVLLLNHPVGYVK